MNRYAVINEDNVVVNVIIWDGEARWSPPVGCCAIRSDECDIYQVYDPETGLFAYPECFFDVQPEE